ncbi:tetratricopeptide repeat protein [bacterium]|nr:tetratricopeptide repeat protein [bacterium]MBP9807074.1 tetratricopeptide repeat protein [bacterium]
MPETWELLKICAENAAANKQYADAEKFMWQAIDEAAKGKSLIIVSLCLDYLGDLYCQQNQFSHAESVYSDCLEKQITALGLDHPELSLILNKLAQCQAIQNKLKESEDSLKQALLINLISHGVNHPQTRWTIKNMEELYQHQNKVFDIQSISGWGNVPAPDNSRVKEALICKTCHRPYQGAQCGNCTQIRMAAIPSFDNELERLSVVCATKDIRAGSIILLGSVHLDLRMVSRSG